MQDDEHPMDISLAGLDKSAWIESLADIANAQGLFQPLGNAHFATFIDDRNTLLVSFESIQGIHALSRDAHPLGFDMVRALGWSHLCLISDGDTWFRDPNVYAFFDRLIDDAFFEDFDRVVFYGAGPGGYAAAAFSIAAPGATVIAVQPQATLDPRVTEWDRRYLDMRFVSFNDRYGYAPEMLQAADHAFVLYDPHEDLDAMHAALFHRPGVTRLRLPFLGKDLQGHMIGMDILYRMLADAGEDRLDALRFARLFRERRSYPPYLRALIARLQRQRRAELEMAVCRSVTQRMKAPKLRRRLVQLEAEKAAREARAADQEDDDGL
ncbi:MAG: phosphoadenosine phosphosulfate reductase [Rhodobacteraceae bacterium]|nr:phosphoadenosine phosphosulfate reductase [Paracoccaceae bacterium]